MTKLYSLVIREYQTKIHFEIRQLYESGYAVQQIAKQLNLSQKNVYRHLRMMKIKLLPRKRNELGQFLKN